MCSYIGTDFCITLVGGSGRCVLTKLFTKYSKRDQASSRGCDDIFISANAGQTTAVISCVLLDHLRDGETAGVAESTSRLSDGESLPRAAETRSNPSNICRLYHIIRRVNCDLTDKDNSGTKANVHVVWRTR